MLPSSCFWVLGLLSSVRATDLTWANTKYLIVFGDSYSSESFDISAGLDSPTSSWTSSNGPNWVTCLRSSLNIDQTKVFNLASGGATTDSALVPASLPNVRSIIDQVDQFEQHLVPPPKGAQWEGNNTLFGVWIGINDVINSYKWVPTFPSFEKKWSIIERQSDISQPKFYTALLSRLSAQLERIYASGGRNFLLTLPPLERAPFFAEQDTPRLKDLVGNYNTQLEDTAKAFRAGHVDDIGRVSVTDTQGIFNTLLNNSQTLGYTNVTGWCQAYESGTPDAWTQILPCAPVSNYFWLNGLHPMFTVHSVLARAISLALS